MDWLDPEVSIEWLADALDIVRQCPGLDFLCVTKRPELFPNRIFDALMYAAMRNNDDTSIWLDRWRSGSVVPSNVWVITSVEDQKRADERIPHLLKIPAVVLGLSVEPLLKPVALGGWLNFGLESSAPTRMIHWVIVGGESAAHRRDCGVEAILDVVRQCQAAGVPCYVKQDCALRPGQQGRIPDDIWRIKEFPVVQLSR